MKWSLMELRKYKEEPLAISETFELAESLVNREKTILAVQPVKIDGFISTGKNEYLLHYRIQTILTLPSSRSLEPVEVPLDLSVDEVFMTREQLASDDDAIEEEIILLDGETIDLIESIEDNILLAIPMQVLTKEEEQSSEMPKGNGWEVISEADFVGKQQEKTENTIDPRLAQLSQLFSDEEDK